MGRPSWLSLVLLTLASIPPTPTSASASDCAVCVRVNKGRLLECLEFCKAPKRLPRPVLNASEENELSPGEPRPGAQFPGDPRRTYPTEHFRWNKPHRNKTREPRPGSDDAKRGYSMEHFRWGKPPGHITPGPKLGQKGSKRNPYAMEHFRWGKPAGRKRKPAKSDGGSPEARFVPRPRGRGNNAARKRKLRPQAGGRRDADVVKSTTNNPQGTLAAIFRDILLKDVQRIMG
ncbi:uncharacterized protein LOC144064293 [Stigmatopora argus]